MVRVRTSNFDSESEVNLTLTPAATSAPTRPDPNTTKAIGYNGNNSCEGITMYGLINAAIKTFAIEKYGEDAWGQIHRSAHAPESYEATKPYEDDVTYNLLMAVGRHANLDANKIQEMLGEYWIGWAVQRDYGVIFKLFGKDFRSSLHSVNQFHQRMKTIMPAMVIPSFQVIFESELQMKVLYSSQRKGLTPLALGLLRGLAAYFQKSVEVSVSSDEMMEKLAWANEKIKEVTVFQIDFK